MTPTTYLINCQNQVNKAKLSSFIMSPTQAYRCIIPVSALLFEGQIHRVLLAVCEK